MNKPPSRRRVRSIGAGIAALVVALIAGLIAPASVASADGTDKELPDRIRGAHISVANSAQFFDPTTEIPRYASWGMNLVSVNIGVDDRSDRLNNTDCQDVEVPSDALEPYEENIARFEEIVAIAETVNLRLKVYIGAAYGRLCTGYWDADGAEVRQHIADVWDALSERFADDEAVVAYGFLSEPNSNPVTEERLATYDTFVQGLVPVVRANDTEAWLVVEPFPWGWGRADGPGGLKDVPIVDDDRVLYEFHHFVPRTFTHQGIRDLPAGVAYPGDAYHWDTGEQYWDAAAQRDYYEPVREWQVENDVRLWVGGFGSPRWAPGYENWVGDSIDLFEEWGWGWAFHSLSGWNGWNPTYLADDPVSVQPFGGVLTPTLEVLIQAWGLNPTNPAAPHIPLPRAVDDGLLTDFSGVDLPNRPRPEAPPGWNQPQGRLALGSNVTDAVLVHTLPAGEPSAQPQVLTYARTTFGFTEGTLHAQAVLDGGESALTRSHLTLRSEADASVAADVWVESDGSWGWSVTDGQFTDSGTEPGVTGPSEVRISASSDAITFHRSGHDDVVVPHTLSDAATLQLQLGASSELGSGTEPVTATADDVVVSNNPGSLSVWKRGGRHTFDWAKG